MKKLANQIILWGLVVLLSYNCTGYQDSIKESELDTKTPKLTELQKYIRETFIKPYNIRIEYQYREFENNIGRILYPPSVDKVKPLTEAVRRIWIEPYNTVAPDLLKNIAPRLLLLVGGYNHNPSGTITLGVAEGGVKITLFNTNQFDPTNPALLDKFYIHTMFHEYTHILNQTKPYVAKFKRITASDYTAQWFNVRENEAREKGFITPYSMTNDIEDFAEMASTMIMTSKEDYQNIIDAINSDSAKSSLHKKEKIVAEYFMQEYHIDIYELRDLVVAARKKIVDDAIAGNYNP